MSVDAARIMLIEHLDGHVNDLSKRLANAYPFGFNEWIIYPVVQLFEVRSHSTTNHLLLTMHTFLNLFQFVFGIERSMLIKALPNFIYTLCI